MKLETRVKDLTALVALREVERGEQRAKKSLETAAVCPAATDARIIDLRKAWQDARSQTQKAREVWKRLPAPRRKAAEELFALGTSHANRVAKRGDTFSGRTDTGMRWGSEARAWSSTGAGEQYSRKCTFHKTDCTHVVQLDPAGLPLLSDLLHDLVAVSQQEGLHIIALYPEDRAVWVTECRGKLKSESGWVTYDYDTRQCFHSTKSREHAVAGLAKKVRVFREEAAQRDPKVQRRLKFIARLCEKAKATMADAKALGFCDPGIAAFQAKYGIGDTATLPELIKTGDPSAVRLALHLAKKIHFKNKPA